MTLLPIVKYPADMLYEVCQPVEAFSNDLEVTLKNMSQTMYESFGIGLAAPQVGILQRFIVVDVSADRSELLFLVNPEITWRSKEQISSEEGCLSIPDYRETVIRNESIVVQAQDAHGKDLELEACDLLSICIQHEIDHLNGILFIDRISRIKKELFKKWYKKRGPFE